MNRLSDYKKSLQRSFAFAAKNYDTCASLHDKVSERLVGKLGELATCPAVCIDVGCGTGILTTKLFGLSPRVIIGLDICIEMCRRTVEKLNGLCSSDKTVFQVVVGDAENLPVRTGSVDLAASSYALHWASDVDACLAELVRVLKPGGVVALSLPVRGSLPELNKVIPLAVGRRDGIVRRFPDPGEIIDYLKARNVQELFASIHTDRLVADSARSLFRTMNRLGVQMAGKNTWSVPPSVALRILEEYDNRHKTDSSVTASFQTLTFIGKTRREPLL